jgi:hypothetical protein
MAEVSVRPLHAELPAWQSADQGALVASQQGDIDVVVESHRLAHEQIDRPTAGDPPRDVESCQMGLECPR